MILENICPHCQSRIWHSDDPIIPGKRRYSVPFSFRNLFKEVMGYYPLNKFIRGECEVCEKKVAIFTDGKKDFYGKIVVLYRCTLSDEPLSKDYCNSISTCRVCELKNSEEYKSKGKYRF